MQQSASRPRISSVQCLSGGIPACPLWAPSPTQLQWRRLHHLEGSAVCGPHWCRRYCNALRPSRSGCVSFLSAATIPDHSFRAPARHASTSSVTGHKRLGRTRLVFFAAAVPPGSSTIQAGETGASETHKISTQGAGACRDEVVQNRDRLVVSGGEILSGRVRRYASASSTDQSSKLCRPPFCPIDNILDAASAAEDMRLDNVVFAPLLADAPSQTIRDAAAVKGAADCWDTILLRCLPSAARCPLPQQTTAAEPKRNLVLT